jgi:hypothetical protein
MQSRLIAAQFAGGYYLVMFSFLDDLAVWAGIGGMPFANFSARATRDRNHAR